MGGTAILLAAGKSTRMGELKGLLPWQGHTLFETQILTLQQSILSEIVVVLGYKAEQFLPITHNYPVMVIYNKNFHTGKCSSIIAGLSTIENFSEPILISAIDQPLDYKIINQLVDSLKNSDGYIAVPTVNGKKGHPVLFSCSIIEDLLSINEESKGLRSVFQKYPDRVIEVPVDNQIVLLNFNTPEDYYHAFNKRF